MHIAPSPRVTTAEDLPWLGLGDGKWPWSAQRSEEPGLGVPLGCHLCSSRNPGNFPPRLPLWRKGKLTSAGPVRSCSRGPLSWGVGPFGHSSARDESGSFPHVSIKTDPQSLLSAPSLEQEVS